MAKEFINKKRYVALGFKQSQVNIDSGLIKIPLSIIENDTLYFIEEEESNINNFTIMNNKNNDVELDSLFKFKYYKPLKRKKLTVKKRDGKLIEGQVFIPKSFNLPDTLGLMLPDTNNLGTTTQDSIYPVEFFESDRNLSKDVFSLATILLVLLSLL